MNAEDLLKQAAGKNELQNNIAKENRRQESGFGNLLIPIAL